MENKKQTIEDVTLINVAGGQSERAREDAGDQRKIKKIGVAAFVRHEKAEDLPRLAAAKKAHNHKLIKSIEEDIADDIKDVGKAAWNRY